MEKPQPGQGPDLRLDEAAGEFTLDGARLPLTPNTLPFETLAFLYRRRGEIVWADELIHHLYGDRVSPDDVSEEQRLEKHVSRVRRTLGPAATSCLVTIRRGSTRPTGYRLMAQSSPPAAGRTHVTHAPRRTGWAFAALVGLAGVTALALAISARDVLVTNLSSWTGQVRISGVVRNDTGQPLAGVRVHAIGGEPCCTTLTWTRTDGSGRYVLQAPDDEVIVQFSPDVKTGYAWEYWDDKPTMFTSERLGSSTDVNAVLARGSLLTVTVQDRSGRPAEAEVRVYGADSTVADVELDYVATAVPGRSGEYLVVLPPGRYRVGLYVPVEHCCEGDPLVFSDLVRMPGDESIQLAMP